MQCGLSLCFKGKCSVVCHCVLRVSAVLSVIVVSAVHCGLSLCFKRVSAVWSVIVVLRG